jgi:hypothetical protein
VQWETIRGIKASGLPPCPNGGIREEKSNNSHIKVILQYYRKYPGHNKLKYDHIDRKWIDIDCVISTVTLSYNFTNEV